MGMLTVLPSSRAGSLPQGIGVCSGLVAHRRPECGSGLARESGGSVDEGVDCAVVFASKLAPTGIGVCSGLVAHRRPECGSELARESGGSVDEDVDCAVVFASKL